MKTNTPKQTVEAMRKEIEAILNEPIVRTKYGKCPHCSFKTKSYIIHKNNSIAQHIRSNHPEVPDKVDKIMALLNPVESQGTQKRGAWNKPLEQSPSPNEAPKGEAAFFYPTKKEVKGLVRFANDLHEKAQPPAPDKEWKKKALDMAIKDWRKQVRGSIRTAVLNRNIPENIIKGEEQLIEIIEHLLLSKDQEADRRIEEVIGEIEKFIKARDFQIFFSYQDKKDWEALKKKLLSK